MAVWQQVAAILAFATVAAVVAFAGPQHKTAAASHSALDRVAAFEK